MVRSTTVRRLLFYGLLVFLALLYLGPFVIQIATSFKTDPDAANNPVSLVPANWTTATYETLFGGGLDFPLWAMNSIIVTVCVTIGRVLFCSMAGYALARLHFRGRGVVFAGIIAVMAVPGVVLLIPKFLVVNQLGIYDTYAGMIVPLLVDAAGVFIMKNFFESIPVSVEEAARIDGAGVWKQYWQIIMPLTLPAIAALATLEFTWIYNDFFWAVVLEQQGADRPITSSLANLGGEFFTDDNLIAAASMYVALPTLIVYFALQRYFIAGLTIGAEKG